MDVEAVAKRLGLAVKVLRVVSGMSQEQLAKSAKELGPPLTQAAVSAIESGNRTLRVDELLAVAAVLDVDAGELLATAVEDGPRLGRLLTATRKKTEEEG